MAKLIQLTENSWLIKHSLDSGLLFKNSESSYELITEKDKKVYSTFEEVEKRYKKFTYDSLTHTVKNQQIKGYSVRHKDDIVEVEESTLPLYTKKNSKIEFVAGFWLLNFKNSTGWTLANCPKKSTITTNPSEGPFLNRLEALNRIAILNSRKD